MMISCLRKGVSQRAPSLLIVPLLIAWGASLAMAQQHLGGTARPGLNASSTAHDGAAPSQLLPTLSAEVLQQQLSGAFGTGQFTMLELALPFDRPDFLSLSLPVDDVIEKLVLRRESLRSASFVARAQLPDGSWQVVPVAPSAAYRATVPGSSGAVVLATLGPLGLRGELLRPGRARLSLRPLASVIPGAGREQHVLFEGGVAEPFPGCGEGHVSPALPASLPALPASLPSGPRLTPSPGLGTTGLSGVGGVSGPAPGPCLSLAEIAFDADFEYFQLHGSSVQAVVDQIESHLNQVDYFYARDTAITYELTQVLIRMAPFYTPIDGGDLLNQFRAEWNANQAGVPRDLAQLMTAKPGSLIEFGGLAWVGAVCNLNLAYGWSMDSAGIIGHEVGHNWNAPHCLDPAPCNAMCGACFSHGPNTKAVIEAWRNAAGCLEAKVLYSSPLPPYVLGESLSLGKEQYATALPASFDVLANDDDGNCDDLSIRSFDALTERGGVVSVVADPGAGLGAADTLLYTAPADLFVGQDAFDYVVGDGSPASTVGRVTIDVRPLRMLGWWPLDETMGSTAEDLADGQLSGAVSGAAWTAGLHGGALAFDGVDDVVTLPALDSSAEAMTLSAWIRRDGSQLNGAGLIVSRDAGTHSGLHFGAFNELRYTWANSILTLLFNPGLTVPDDEWVFVALTVEATSATVYLGDGTSLQSATNTVNHLPQSFAGETTLGSDPAFAARFFAGDMDEVRLWDHALSSDEIAALWSHGGRAELPLPADGGLAPDAVAGLRWVPGLEATSHDVYLGTSYAAVRDGTTLSAEFAGNVLAPPFVTPPLSQGTTWYWRVDELVGADVVIGDVWQLRVADTGHWPLDELLGTTALDAQGNVPGSYVGSPTLGVVAPTPFTGTAVRFTSNGDGVRLPALNLQTNEATLALWVRRIGDQSDFAGLLFTRDGNSVAGLNFGSANELRYHWNGAGDTWGFDSQLILPDKTWVFCALVVRPDSADLYMGVDGAPLVSATNMVNHGPEEWDGEAWLGQDPTGGRWFNGRLDEPRVFDRALTEKELRQIYEDALNGLP